MEEEKTSSAAELRPELVQDTCRKLAESVRTVNTFPTGSARDLYSTYTGFNAVVGHLSECVLAMANGILQAQGIRVKLNKESTSLHSLVLVNDEILDQIGLTTKPNTSKEILEQITDIGPRLQRKAPAPGHEPLIKKHGTRRVHPFVKTHECTPPLWLQRQRHTGIHMRDPESTPFEYVQTEEALESLARHLDTVSYFAVDVEHHSQRSYLGVTCLIQITTEAGDYIVDCFPLWEHIRTLNSSFANHNIIKVLHGARNDVIWLQRDFGLYIAGLFDTHEAAIALSLPHRKLADLVSKYCGVQLDKSYQMSNWSVRPLEEDQIKYARLDTHYLLYVWQRMLDELLQSEQRDQVRMVFTRSAKLTKKCYNEPAVDENEYKVLYNNTRIVLGEHQDRVLRCLYRWRDDLAKKEDESVEYVAPGHMLMKLAEHLPRTPEDVEAACGSLTPLVASNLSGICDIIATCLQNIPATTSSDAAVTGNPQENMNCDLDRNDEIRPQPIREVQSLTPMELPEREAASADHLTFVPPYRRYQLYKCWQQSVSSK